MAKKKKRRKKKVVVPEKPPPPKVRQEFTLADAEGNMFKAVQHHLKLQTKMLNNSFTDHKKTVVQLMGKNIKDLEKQVKCTLDAVKDSDGQTQKLAQNIEDKKWEIMMLKQKLGMATAKKEEDLNANILLKVMKKDQKKKILQKFKDIKSAAARKRRESEAELLAEKNQEEKKDPEDGKGKKLKKKKIVLSLPVYKDVEDLPFENVLATVGRGHYDRYKKRKEDELNRALERVDDDALKRFDTRINKKSIFKKGLPPFWVKYSKGQTKRIVKKNYGETSYLFTPALRDR